MNIEVQVQEILQAAREYAGAGQLDDRGLQVAIAAQQEFIDYLDALLDADQLFFGDLTNIDNIAGVVAERMDR